jgi:hypothetical protein
VIRVVTAADQDADCAPRAAPLAAGLGRVWAAALPVEPGASRLLAWGAGLALVDGRRGLVEVGPEPPRGPELAPWTRYDLPLAGVARGCASPAVLLAADGTVYRWQPGGSPTPAWVSGRAPAGFGALGLPGDRLLIRWAEGDRRRVALLDAPAGRLVWEQPGGALVLPVDDRLLLEPAEAPHTVRCLELDGGRQRWQSRPIARRIGAFIGVVGAALWLATLDGTVCSLSLDSGRLETEVALYNNKAPAGVLDPRGHYHACHGLNYQVLDLSAGGKILAYAEFVRGERGPSTANGQAAALADDGRLVFADDAGRVFVCHQAHAARPEPVCETGAIVLSLGIAHRRLHVLSSDGALAAFGAT